MGGAAGEDGVALRVTFDHRALPGGCDRPSGPVQAANSLLVLFRSRCEGYSTHEMQVDGLPIWRMSASIRHEAISPKIRSAHRDLINPM
jgi:hypothetical protein